MNNEWLSVGRIRDAHGIKGEVFVALKAKQADWLDQLEVFRLVSPAQLAKPGTARSAENKDYLTLEVLTAKAHKDGLIVRFKGVEDRNQAEALRGSRVEIPSDYVTASEDEPLFMGQYLGLEVEDKTLGILGKVVGLGSNGPQDLLVVETAKGRFDIPLVEAFIVELNLEQKYLKMDLPIGLVEV